MSSYRQALSIDADFKPSRQNLAQALIQKKQHDQALFEFERFCQHPNISASESVVGLQGRMACLMELNRYDEGLQVADSCSDDRRIQLMTRLHAVSYTHLRAHET